LYNLWVRLFDLENDHATEYGERSEETEEERS
jgi:hypothetical protein